MTRLEEALRAGLEAPFTVVALTAPARTAVIEGFTENDPLGVGGGFLPSTPTAYFEGGGWCLVPDLIAYWDLPEADE